MIHLPGPNPTTSKAGTKASGREMKDEKKRRKKKKKGKGVKEKKRKKKKNLTNQPAKPAFPSFLFPSFLFPSSLFPSSLFPSSPFPPKSPPSHQIGPVLILAKARTLSDSLSRSKEGFSSRELVEKNHSPCKGGASLFIREKKKKGGGRGE
jgi:hypothetical protein